MTWGLPVRGGYRTSAYGPRTSPGGVGSTWHRGVDVGGRGTDWLVRSVGPGRVLARGTNAVRGRWVAVRHDDGTTTAYQHLASVSATGRVEAGTVLGVMGQTGTSTATHLHLEAFPEGRFALVGDAFATTGRAVDPEPYLYERGVDLHAGTVTVGRPGPSTGTVPDITIPGPVAPIVPEEDIVASIEDLERVVGDAVAPLRRALRAYRLDVPGAQALYAQVGTARVWLKTAAEVAAVAPGPMVPLPADDTFWAQTVVYAVGELYRRKGDATGAAFVLAGADVDGRRVPTLRHVTAAEYAAMGRPLLVDVDPAHPLWSRPVLGS